MSTVGVVVPLHNKEGYIQRCLQSVLRQSHADIQVTVVDDGSTDSSVERLLQIRDPRVRLIRTACHGPGAARNVGLRSMATEWIGFLDADDSWEPVFLEKTLAAAQRFPQVVAVFTDIRRPPGSAPHRPVSGAVIEDYLGERMRRRIAMSSSTVLVRRTVLAFIGGFREDARYAEDSDTWFRLSCEGPSYYIAEPLAEIGMSDPAAITRSADSESRAAGLRALLDSYERYLRCGRIPPHCLAGCRRFMQHQRGRLALHLLLAGERAAGLRTLLGGVPPGPHTWREYLHCAAVLFRSGGHQASARSRRRSARPTR